MLFVMMTALGRMSVACGPASMLLPKDSATETTTAELPNTTDIRDAHLPSANVTLSSAKNNEEPLQLDYFGKRRNNNFLPPMAMPLRLINSVCRNSLIKS